MTLVQSWMDSLALLKPKNLQLFAMVTLKSIIEAYKLMFKYFWWLLLVPIVLLFITPNYSAAFQTRDMNSLVYYVQLTGVAVLSYTLLFLAVCFITRPSVVRKDWSYFGTQWRKIILYWFLYWIVYWFVWCVVFILSSITKTLVPLFQISTVPLFQISAFSPGYTFLVLFFIDSDGGLKNLFLSLWRTLKMVIYNYPLLIVIGICFYVPIFVFNQYVFISPLMWNVIACLLLPIGVCTYANIYIKKIHDQFDLYFKPMQ